MDSSGKSRSGWNRRQIIRRLMGGAGLGSLLAAAQTAEAQAGREAPIPAKDRLRITRLETFLVQPRWLFLKVHTNAGMYVAAIAFNIGQSSRALSWQSMSSCVSHVIVGAGSRIILTPSAGLR